ncbi:dTDP-4-dehydrorhamnose reductase [Sphingobacterium psychroaquaticum]|uniref:dTDP-4-dehydrorhamnose reductase n=1 Tax=Sphingobacterium psychroaquaticum TaxID=561061 RepID=A0A1X7K684_9SPHI|nr:dTDP-4-dehydrorhamnose reductase [Sphingobacterium psychroaquaticum]QBQ42695.1 dTDP-4-dehydrorhamnose reductase [Sphingobacterium psychroaquaticum]SMG36573.1 dTDP-4-dehydrorhamnose reductase [Sphingobacterium psychroaquaticum]
MKILVTGANGQLGSELHDILQKHSDKECFFLDRKQLPLDQTAIIQDILAMYHPDVIIHAAAYTAVDKAENEPDLADRINHLASEEIAQYCRLNETKLIAVSTDYVFDGNSDTPLKEDAPVAPINVYGESKLKGEHAIMKWHPESIIIRTSWVYSTYGNNFVKTMIRLMTERDEISVINDQIGSPTYAKDLAQAIVDIVDSEDWVGGIYHYSNEGEISWYDFAAAIKEVKGLASMIHPIPTAQYPTPAKRPRYSLLDKSKIHRTFGVEVPDWRESLEKMLGIL